jgi:tRNA threonylcarbamoyladenosine modification (KEOPS) complex  Pcc1 subunit
MKARVVVLRVSLPSAVRAPFLQALKPETLSPIRKRFQVNVKEVKNGITLEIKAADISALRAAVSAYVRWLVGIGESLNALKNSSRGADQTRLGT